METKNTSNQPEIKSRDHKPALQQCSGNDIYDWIIVAPAKRRVGMRDNGDVSAPSRGVWIRRIETFGMINSAVEFGMFIYAWDSEGQRGLWQHLVDATCWNYAGQKVQVERPRNVDSVRLLVG